MSLMQGPARPALAGLIVLSATALIAACGGGEERGASAEEYRDRAAAICTDVNRQLGALGDPESRADEDVLLVLRARRIERLGELRPPEELRQGADAALTLAGRERDAIQDVLDRIDAGEEPQVLTSEADEIDSLSAQADMAFEDLGVPACATDPGGAGDGPLAAYEADVLEAVQALRRLGAALSSARSPRELSGRLEGLEGDLDDFDAAIADLEGYTLPDRQLETRRSGLARTGPAVSDVLRRLLVAIADEDLARVQRLLPEFRRTVADFQRAGEG